MLSLSMIIAAHGCLADVLVLFGKRIVMVSLYLTLDHACNKSYILTCLFSFVT